MKLEDVQELPGWVSVARAARLLGCSKQVVYYRMRAGELPSIFKILGEDKDARPLYLVSLLEVEKLQAKADAASKVVKSNRLILVNERNHRIKAWGRDHWSGVIFEKGQPQRELVDAYEAAHPQDVLPELGPGDIDVPATRPRGRRTYRAAPEAYGLFPPTG